MAKVVYDIAIDQKSERLRALCLLSIGDINKNLRTLQECLHIYEKSQDQVLNNYQYSCLCLYLAREYRKIGTNNQNNHQKAMFFLEQAFTLNASDQANSEVMMQYYAEMGEVYISQKKDTEAAECMQKALKISKKVYGQEHFTTLECYLNLAQQLEKAGKKEEADKLFEECLENFEKKDA